MKKIYFKELSIKNFLSIGTEPVTISFQPGINLITGINLDKEDASNGSGKSSVVNAVYFCLYGKTLKELKIDQIPNSYTRGSCEVELKLSVAIDKNTKEYIIRRSLRPSKLLVFENGVDITRSTIVQTSQLVQDIISCTDSVFEKSIVMDANNATTFMAQKKVEKRKFLEGILNLEIFGEMLSIARNDYNDKKFEYDTESAKLQEKSRTLAAYQEQRELQDKDILSRQRGIQEKIDELESNIKEISSQYKQQKTQDQVKELQDKQVLLKQKLKDRENTSKSLYIKKGEINLKVSNLTKELNNIKSLPEMCGECNRPFTAEEKNIAVSRKERVKDEILLLSKELKTVERDIQLVVEQNEKINEGLTAIASKISLILEDIKFNEQIKWKIDTYKNTLEGLHKDLADVSTKTNTYTELVEKVQVELDEITRSVKSVEEKLEVLQAAKFILSEEGVRSYIVKKILKVLNSRLNMYLNKLDANTKGEFNEYFEETLQDQFGNVRSYYNFSSGEQRRIDLAILFAFQDIRRLQADVSMNISIYDELLDSSLDRKGAELVLFLLKERAQKNNECVYIISHRKEAQSSHVTRTITLKKQNGITTLASL